MVRLFLQRCRCLGKWFGGDRMMIPMQLLLRLERKVCASEGEHERRRIGWRIWVRGTLF